MHSQCKTGLRQIDFFRNNEERPPLHLIEDLANIEPGSSSRSAERDWMRETFKNATIQRDSYASFIPT
jgi:hypothetical protein